MVLVSVAAACATTAVVWWLAGSRPSATAVADEGGTPAAVQSQASDPAATGDPAPTGDAVPSEDATPTGDAIPTGEATPTGEPTAGGDAVAAQQAGQVESLLSSSSSTRSNLSTAIADATRCRRNAVDTIEDITASRRDQLTAARTLELAALPDGAALKQTLIAALDASYDADTAFLSWARRHLAGGCTGPVSGDRDYRRGLSRSEAAQTAKAQFAQSWQPIAEAYDLTIWKAHQI
ncbi:hypothetical protein DMB42_10400 [Nonomuraea sp. WAC 01424]|uniref:hypothetical protein n=1 Tax=Nonomuraea sp. WAC 01424 TaxID=2203200 RepID=UPI000F76F346|nr:hypothetical protein [Nonomuraea sp. WAC 01424]RSN12605.1 hypothetical protein DMB42_10400 [Nonomuraea sp. WAC 01424]